MTRRRKTTEEFMAEMRVNHPTLEVKSEYINSRTKVDLKCSVCGYEFSAVPGSLYMGHGCPKCAGVARKDTNMFISVMKEVNPDVIILGEYKNKYTKLKVKCAKCGYEWFSTPNALLSGRGCAKCSGRMRKTTEQFEKDLQEIYPNLYVIGAYKNNRTKIRCKCSLCGTEFESTPHSILSQRVGCPSCGYVKSKGENRIDAWLTDHGIKFTRGHTFSDCKDVHVLPFDFYLSELNTIIEYDGKQHFKPSEYFGGEDGFKKTVEHDEMKNNYCKDNNIDIIRIPYWHFDNIDEILSEKLAS